VALCILLVAPAARASVVEGRAYDSNIPGFASPTSIAFDAAGNAWISDGSHYVPKYKDNLKNGVYRYSPYPSQSLLDVPDTSEAFGGDLGIQLAVDQATEEVFVTQYNGRSVGIFAPNSPSNPCKQGNFCFSHKWSSINGVGGFEPGIHVAIDNSNSFSKGRVYLSLAHPENDVEVLDAGRLPVELPATAGYIHENKLTGTPSGKFGEVANITVDNEGNVYVTDPSKNVVDEFASTGLFLRAFPSPRANQYNNNWGGAAVDPTNGNVLILEGNYFAEGEEGGIREYDASGNYLSTITKDLKALGEFAPQGTPAVDSAGYLYTPANYERVDIYKPAAIVPTVTYGPVSSPTTTSGTLNAHVDPNGGGNVTECKFQYGTSTSYGTTLGCSAESFSAPTDVSTSISGLSTETTYHYRVVVHNENGVKYGADQTYTPNKVVGLTTEPATDVTESGATLHASFAGNGEATHYYFEWGLTPAYGNTSASPPGTPAGAPSGATPLTFALADLSPYTTYHYRVVASNGAGESKGDDMVFTTTPGVPTIHKEAASDVHSDRAILHGEVNANGADTRVHYEYVNDAAYQSGGFAGAPTTPEVDVGMGKHTRTVEPQMISGLESGTVYHYRAVATNEAGTVTIGTDHTFRTFPFEREIKDPCANAHVRQQTGAALLLDCRAYELVSVSNAGGYDVESSLVPGQTPFGGYPEALGPSGEPEVLYGVHDGGIPGTGNPTNRGVDPYVATRSPQGWKTKYVGFAADGTPSAVPFSSTLAEADANLGTFAFGGPEICSPCFPDGSTGNPIRLPNGQLVQGMAGSLPQPAGEPAGFIGRHLSADGSHFVFGSKSQFEPDGNNNGDVSIYDRNLNAGVTHVVSKTPAGATMTGAGIGELDISKDGSRIVIGQLVSEEGEAKQWHLYMNIGDSTKTVDLTPGASSGALYDGMTGDGSRVFFTTKDELLGADTDNSADIYAAEVDPSGNLTLSLISTGSEGTGNTDACHPAANTIYKNWNTTGGEESCGVVAVGGGGGVAAGNGTIFFLSPEKLDGSANGVQDAPNMYVAPPGEPPRFVATLESAANAPLPAPVHPFVRSFGPFEKPAGVAIDHQTGDVYVFDIPGEGYTGFITKWTASGHPITSFGNNGVVSVAGTYGFSNAPSTIAVDNDPASPSYRDFYVPELTESIVAKFNPNGGHVSNIEFPDPTAVATNPANGDLYVGTLLSAFFSFPSVWVFSPEGELTTSLAAEESPAPTGIGVDPATEDVYVANAGGYLKARGTTEEYDSSGTHLKTLDSNQSLGVAVDPMDGHVYVDEGNQVTEFTPSGTQVGAPFGSDRLGGSMSLAADYGTLDISNLAQTGVATYGPAVVPSGPETDNPLVIDSVGAPGKRNTSDFQVTGTGEDAVFTSTLPLTGYDTGFVHREIYRYDAASGVECASCSPTGEQATGEASLPPNGLGVSNDGRVFFDSTEGLVDRDLNNRMDAYEWEAPGFDFGNGTRPCELPTGCVELISSGASPFPAGLLSVGADGTDAYFFTRDRLAEEDENGNSVKIYDARSLGGFPFVPPPVQCKASDECHGPSSPIPPAPDIKTVGQTPGGQVGAKACKKGLIEKRGKCVRKSHKHGRRHHRTRHGRRPR
jgi:hypothetical protein